MSDTGNNKDKNGSNTDNNKKCSNNNILDSNGKRQSIRYKRHHYTTRDETPLESALESTWDETQSLLKKLPVNEGEGYEYKPDIENPIFCGHLMADLDSIAGAIGAAILLEGTPARASPINAETKFALEYWNCQEPDYVEDLINQDPDRKVCLVDFQQRSQLHEAIQESQIVGIIDHHALQSSTIITERPIFVDIRPVCTAMVSIHVNSLLMSLAFLLSTFICSGEVYRQLSLMPLPCKKSIFHAM